VRGEDWKDFSALAPLATGEAWWVWRGSGSQKERRGGLRCVGNTGLYQQPPGGAAEESREGLRGHESGVGNGAFLDWDKADDLSWANSGGVAGGSQLPNQHQHQSQTPGAPRLMQPKRKKLKH